MKRSGKRSRQLSQLFDDAHDPIFVLDDRRKIVYCNDALAQWASIDADDLLGVRCNYHSGDASRAAEAIGARLCPPPDVFTGKPCESIVACQDASGRLSRHRATFLPLGTSTASCTGVVGVIDSESLAAEAAQVEPADSAVLHDQLREFLTRRAADESPGELIGTSPQIMLARRQAELAALSDCNVLVIGPEGSGREFLTRSIHARRRTDATLRLLPIDCPLMDAELLQTTLLAVMRTAHEDRHAWPVLLLLDADQLSSDGQMELNGFLELPSIDLQVMATASHDVRELAGQATFRADLAHELATLIILLPALEDRPEDIPLLAQHFLEQENARGARQLAGFTTEVLDMLVGHQWQTQIDELAGVVRQCHAKAEGTYVTPIDLPADFLHAQRALLLQRPATHPVLLDDALLEVEKELLRRAMRMSQGNKTKAAKSLGISRARFHRRWDQLSLGADVPAGADDLA